MSKLVAPDGDAEDWFGSSVGVSSDGSTAVIGAQGDEDPNGKSAGSAYVFSRKGGSWSQQTKLAAKDGDKGDSFGYSVAVSGDGSTAIVGAQEDEDPNGEKAGSAAGSAYVFSRSGGSWSQQAKLAAPDGDAKDEFGWSVGVSGDGSTAIVGAHGDEDPNGGWGGSAYVFSRSGGSWSQQAKLAVSDDDDHFGWSVGMSNDGSTAIVGAPYDEDPNGEWAGSAYVFSRMGGSWSQQAKLAAKEDDDGGLFGSSVAMSGDGSTAVIGAHYDEDPNGFVAGSAYVFE